MPYDVLQDRQKECQGSLVLAVPDIAVQRVKEPQRRIGRVVEALILSFREQVRDQAVAHIVSEGAQDPACLDRSPGRQSEAFQRDHCVPAPVGEPVMAGDHGAHFITLGPRPGPVGNASNRGNDEGVGRKDELGCEADLCRRRRHPNETPAALAFKRQRIVGAQRQHSMPSLGCSDQRQRAILADLSGKVAGAPQPAPRIVTALRLDVVKALAAHAAIGGKGRAFGALHRQPQSRQIRPGADLVSVAPDGQRIARGQRLTDRRLERTKVDQGSHPQADAPAVAERAKRGMHNVLARGHDNRLLDDEAIELISPARQAHCSA